MRHKKELYDLRHIYWPQSLNELVVRNQLNQKLKLMVEDPLYVIYFNTPPYIRAIWTKSVDATQTLLIFNAKYSTLKGCNFDFPFNTILLLRYV